MSSVMDGKAEKKATFFFDDSEVAASGKEDSFAPTWTNATVLPNEEAKAAGGLDVKVEVSTNVDGKIDDGAERASLLAGATELTAIEEDDPWALPAFEESVDRPWSDLPKRKKAKKIALAILRPVALMVLLYIFVCSLDVLTAAFRLVGGKLAGAAFREDAIIANPIAGLMVGILVTLLVQSSSTSTSIVVAMVASGILTVKLAIPIIMGANIGTSITNTLVSLAQSSDRNAFRRAFGGATVHDMFNWLTVLVLLPLEQFTGYLLHVTQLIVNSFALETNKDANKEFLKTITKPITDHIVQLNETVFTQISLGKPCYENTSLIKEWCAFTVVHVMNRTGDQASNDTCVVKPMNGSMSIGTRQCDTSDFFFNLDLALSDGAVGGILLVLSLAALIGCLLGIVKTLSAMMQGQVAAAIRRTVNADFPGKLSFLTGYVAILVGAALTIVVQSSSVFTSTLTPLVGLGVITIERVYPLTLGSNVGTTFTSLLAALAAPKDKLPLAIQISLCHLFFNLSGIVLFYPVPVLRRLPIRLAKMLGDTTAEYRWFAVAYLLLAFVLVPGGVFALSLAGTEVLMSVVGVVALLAVTVVTINTLQRKRPQALPLKLRSWEFLPLWMHSLKPLDDRIQMALGHFKRSCCCACCPKYSQQQRLASVPSSADCSPFGSKKHFVNVGAAHSHAVDSRSTYRHACFRSTDSRLPLVSSQSKVPHV